MTINIYPEIVRKQDLSPDEGFGPEIDDACNVRVDVPRFSRVSLPWPNDGVWLRLRWSSSLL